MPRNLSSCRVWHIEEYPTKHHFGIPRYTESSIFENALPGIQVKNCIVEMFLTCIILFKICLHSVIVNFVNCKTVSVNSQNNVQIFKNQRF